MIKNIGSKIAPNIIKQTLAMGGLAVVGTQLLKKEVTSSETLDYMDKSAVALSSRVVLNNEYDGPRPGEPLEDFFARMRRRREEVLDKPTNYDFDYNIDDSVSSKITDKKVFEKELKKFKNPHIIKVAKHLFKENLMFENTLNMLYDIEVNSRNIKDTYILSRLNNIYNEILSIEADDLDPEISGDEDTLLGQANSIIDSYNTIKGNYVQFKNLDYCGFVSMEMTPSKTQDFLALYDCDIALGKKSLRDQINEHFEGKASTVFAKEFLLAQKIEVFEKLNTDRELQDYLYNVLLKNSGYSASIIKRCKSFNEKYSIMIFPSLYSKDMNKDLDLIEKELSAWQKASNGKAKFPKGFVLNCIEPSFLTGTAGSDNLLTGIIHLDGRSVKRIMYSIRHEIMHENDQLISNFGVVGEERAELLREIMPIKMVEKTSLGGTKRQEKVRDYQNCKYKEEFLKAGIDACHISYAYKDRNEFLAVAAEGDMSKYSPEFKSVLIKLGMPDFVFDLEVIDPAIKERSSLMSLVESKYPEVTDFNTLIQLQEYEELLKRQRGLKMLSEIFKDL